MLAGKKVYYNIGISNTYMVINHYRVRITVTYTLQLLHYLFIHLYTPFIKRAIHNSMCSNALWAD